MSDTRAFLGRGLRFPPQVDPATGRFRMTEAEEDIRQSIQIILTTRRGERVMLPDFGCRLSDYVFELPDGAAQSMICAEAADALTRCEPRITDVSVDVDGSGLPEGRLVLHIHYLVRDTNNPHNIVFPYYLYEGVGEV